MNTYNGFNELPNRRGEYLVAAEFANGEIEVCQVTIAYDVDEENDTEIKTAYAYIVHSVNGENLYTACFGFATVRATIAECEARIKTIA